VKYTYHRWKVVWDEVAELVQVAGLQPLHATEYMKNLW
jgi:hypothetical protein